MSFQSELFDNGPQSFTFGQGKATFYRNFLPVQAADRFLSIIKDKTLWESGYVHIAGKQIPIPRLNAWYADPGIHYAYSGIKLTTQDWYPELLEIRQFIHEQTGYY
ncbi:MAG: alpha-ketoglutarate-dependent dioxygenase AlkB, partial [Lentisphaeraceae bacterium]|nr:alpha-ketoglutarate-dependent dioxygenase AlkB [Lentisphaeraceae bacterium]